MLKYECADCGAKYIKLWRQYQTSDLTTLCAACVSKRNGVDISQMREDGKILGKLGNWTDQLEWWIPAVPDFYCHVETYWGYTSVPDYAVTWWRGLLNRTEG